MRIFKLVSVIVMCVISLSMKSQNNTKGHIIGVVTSVNNQILPGATLILNKTSFGVQTDIKGKYFFKNIPFGSYTITASFMGYNKVSKTIQIGMETKEINFRLSENLEVLEEVNIKGETKKHKIETEGFTVNSIDISKHKNSSLTVSELLDRSSGIKIRQTGGLGSHLKLNINGLSGNSIRIFVNGIPAENYGQGFSINNIPASMIQRIDVYKGVVPASFGSDALGGAINIVLNESTLNEINASYSFGSFNTHQTSLNGVYNNDSTGFTIRGSMFTNYSDNNYDVWGRMIYITKPNGQIEYIKAKRFHDKFKQIGINFSTGFTNVSWADHFLVGANLSAIKKDIQHGATMETVYGSRRAEDDDIMVNLNYDKKNIIKNLDFKLFSSYTISDRKNIDTNNLQYNWLGELIPDKWNINDGDYLTHLSGAESGAPTLNTNSDNKFVVQSTITYKVNKLNTFSVNYTSNHFYRSSFDPLLTAALQNAKDTRSTSKNIVGINYSFSSKNDRLKLSTFFKYYKQQIESLKPKLVSVNDEVVTRTNRFNKKTSASGIGGTFSYKLFNKFHVILSGEKTIRLPSSRELFGNAASNIDENQTLNPEKSTNYNFGINYSGIHVNKHVIGVNTNVFYRNIQDKIKSFLATDEIGEYSTYINANSFLSTGFDLELKYSYNNQLFTSFGTSVFNSRFNTKYDEKGLEYMWYKDREPNEPFFTFNYNTRYILKEFKNKSKLSFYYNLAYVDMFYLRWESVGSNGKAIIPAQLIHDFGVSYKFYNEKLTVNTDFKNFTNQQAFDNWGLQKPGRAFYIKVNYQFLNFK